MQALRRPVLRSGTARHGNISPTTLRPLRPRAALHRAGAALVAAILPAAARASVLDSMNELQVLSLGAAIAALLAALVALPRWRTVLRRTATRVGPARDAFDAEELLELLDLSSDWLWKTDEQHRYVHVTAGLREHSRIDPKEFIGLTPWELDCGGNPPEDWEACRKSIAERAPLRLTLCHRDRAQRRCHLELTGRPVFRGGHFAGYQGIGRDVTLRIETERALRENQVRYREVIESVNEIIFRTDAAGRLTFLNRAWETITGYSLKESLDTALVDYFHPDDRNAAWHQMASVSRLEHPAFAAQLRIRTRRGEVRWIEAAAHPVSHPDGGTAPAGLAGTLFDISARKIAEMTLRNINQELEARVRLRTAELEASNRELEAFSYSVSHDLRAPLRAIDGFARILEEELAERLDDDARDHLARIRKATGRMSHLIDDLLKLAQLTRQSLHKETFDLSELALQIVDELRANDPERPVAVEITTGLIVTADRSLMQIALENLLQNAWKFSSRNPQAHISLTAERERERRVFCVADNGVGFDMAFANKLFRPFHRLHVSADFPGSGIGLANVHRIIERHGGTIWAKSKPGEGARFYFTLGA